MKLTLVATHRLPELFFADSWTRAFAHDGRRAAVIGQSGQVWLLALDPERPSLRARKTQYSVALPKERGRIQVAWQAGRICTADFGSGPQVFDLTSKQRVPVPRVEYTNVALTPDGRWMYFFQSGTPHVADLETGEVTAASEMDLIEEGGETKDFYLDHPDATCIRPRDDGSFELYIACYGIVLVHTLRPVPGRPPERVRGESRFMGECVYDPTEVVTSPGTPFIAAVDSCTVHAIDRAGDKSHVFEVPDGKKGYFGATDAQPGFGCARMWVWSRGTNYLWEPGAWAEPLPDTLGAVLAVYPDRLLCIDPKRPNALWYAIER